MKRLGLRTPDLYEGQSPSTRKSEGTATRLHRWMVRVAAKPEPLVFRHREYSEGGDKLPALIFMPCALCNVPLSSTCDTIANVIMEMMGKDMIMLAVLRQRNFALLWFGQLISLTGDYVLIVALPFYTYQLTGSVLATGIMFLVQALPGLFLGSLAGVFVDRWDRRWTMIASDLLRAGVLLFLLLARSRDLVWIIYVVALTEQLISLFFIPAKGAIIPNIVAEQHLLPANSFNSSSDAVPPLVCPPLAPAILPHLSRTIPFFITPS